MSDNIPFSQSGGLPKLAPDLTYPSDKVTGSQTYKTITGIDGSSGLTTALSLTGKFLVPYLQFSNILFENITIKLTVDGVIIWNDTFSNTSTIQSILGTIGVSGTGSSEDYTCASTFLLELQTATDASVDLTYLARPIL